MPFFVLFLDAVFFGLILFNTSGIVVSPSILCKNLKNLNNIIKHITVIIPATRTPPTPANILFRYGTADIPAIIKIS